MGRFLLFLVGLAGLPLAWALGRAFLDGLAAGLFSGATLTPGCVAFACGGAAMAALYFWKGRALSPIYVFGHELTHALVGLCCLARVHRVSVRETGGFVELSKSNLAITLAPYCVPLYLLLALGLCAGARFLWPGHLFWPWAALFGALTLFHVLYTLDALLTVAQPDILEYGRLFSYWLILTVNLLFANLALPAAGLTAPGFQAAALLYRVFGAYATLAETAFDLIPSREKP